MKAAFFVENRRAFSIIFLSTSSSYESYLPAFEQSLQTFEIYALPDDDFPLLLALIMGTVTVAIIAAGLMLVKKRPKNKPKIQNIEPIQVTTSTSSNQNTNNASPSSIMEGQSKNVLKYCPNCGAQNEANAKSCNTCETNLPANFEKLPIPDNSAPSTTQFNTSIEAYKRPAESKRWAKILLIADLLWILYFVIATLNRGYLSQLEDVNTRGQLIIILSQLFGELTAIFIIFGIPAIFLDRYIKKSKSKGNSNSSPANANQSNSIKGK